MGGRWEGKDWMTGHDWTDDLSDLAGFGCLLSTQPVGPPPEAFQASNSLPRLVVRLVAHLFFSGHLGKLK